MSLKEDAIELFRQPDALFLIGTNGRHVWYAAATLHGKTMATAGIAGKNRSLVMPKESSVSEYIKTKKGDVKLVSYNEFVSVMLKNGTLKESDVRPRVNDGAAKCISKVEVPMAQRMSFMTRINSCYA